MCVWHACSVCVCVCLHVYSHMCVGVQGHMCTFMCVACMQGFEVDNWNHPSLLFHLIL